MKTILRKFIFILVFISYPSIYSFATNNQGVGIVRTTGDAEISYKLIRNGQEINEIKHNMEVLNGDIIKPLKKNEKKLILDYFQKECGQNIISKETRVFCDPSRCKSIGGYFEQLKRIIKKISPKIKRIHLSEIQTETIRAKNSTKIIENKNCVNNELNEVASWPPDGSTIMCNKPIFFKWSELHINNIYLLCTKGKLIIEPVDERYKPIINDYKIGEIIKINEPLVPGFCYQWYVKKDGKIIFDTYKFSILSKLKTDNIQTQLKAITNLEINKIEYEPILVKSLYLQIISDTIMNINLYPDSFRLFLNNKAISKISPIGNMIRERIIFHQNQNQLPYNIDIFSFFYYSVNKPLNTNMNNTKCFECNFFLNIDDIITSMESFQCEKKKFNNCCQEVNKELSNSSKITLPKCSIMIIKKRFWKELFYVTNSGSRRLHVHILNLNSNGSSHVIFPRLNARKQAFETEIDPLIFDTSGIEKLLFIVDVQPIDMSLLSLTGFHRSWVIKQVEINVID